MALDLDSYRRQAQGFCDQLDREYYLHLAGHKHELEIEPIYERHRELFGPRAVDVLRAEAERAPGAEARGPRYLLEFAVHGHVGLATREHSARIALIEAELELELGSERIPYRAAPIVQANEPGAGRREAIAAARERLLDERLNPLYLEALQRSHEAIRGLGWPSYREACGELSGIDLEALAGRTRSLRQRSDPGYAQHLGPELERQGLPALGELRRSDLPRLFRAPGLDGTFPADRMVTAFAHTLAGLGIDLDRQRNIHLDTASRPSKSPRAFCATPKVPDEIYLVVSPTGGLGDYVALFHEGGHAEHYGHTDPRLAFELRHLGDNSVTESFAFLLESLTSNPAWLETHLGVEDPAPVATHARVANLVMLRRYAAKLAYELELHRDGVDPATMPRRYAELLGDATGVAWPRESWLADVDPAFYVVRYLRAWALEAMWRSALTERFGERWFESGEAGAWLRGLWRDGQRLDADELAEQALGERVDFGRLTAELVGG